MKIGITGSDSVGKSSLIRDLVQLLSHTQTVGVISIGDIARRSPFPHIARQTIQSSRWVLDQVKQAEASAERDWDIVICDRTVMDIWVFSRIATFDGAMSAADLASFETDIGEWLTTYRVVFCATIDKAFPINIENIPDGDIALRERFEDVLLSGLKHFEGTLSHVMLPSTLDERLRLIASILEG